MDVDGANDDEIIEPKTNQFEILKHYFRYGLRDLASVRSYDYDLPTLAHTSFQDREEWTESETFAKHFYDKFPFLETTLKHDLIVFGGCIVNFLMKRKAFIRDVDIVFISSTNLEKRVERFIEDIKSWAEKQNRMDEAKFNKRCLSAKFTPMYKFDEMLVTRYKGVYQIKLPFCDIPIQISASGDLKLFYDNIDIGCTQVVFCCSEICIGERAKFEIENLAINVNSKYKDILYAKRLSKYFENGFDLILADLDIDLIPTRNLQFKGGSEMLDLPFMNILIYEKSGKKLVGNIYSIHGEENSYNNNSDWGSGGRKDDISSIIHDNVCKMAKKQYENMTFWGKGENYKNAFLPTVVITERQLINIYSSTRHHIYNEGKLNLKTLMRYYPVAGGLSVMMNDLLTGHMKGVSYYNADDDETKKIDWNNESVLGNNFGTEFEEHIDKYLKYLSEMQIVKIRFNIKEYLETTTTIPIIMKPTVIADANASSVWYGKYCSSSKKF